MDSDQQNLLDLISEILLEYDVGKLLKIERNERGTVNTNFALDIDRGGRLTKYFLRRYKNSIKQTEIEFEHSIVSHLFQKGINFAARIYSTRENLTFLKKIEHTGTDPVFYALFDFLPGEDKYTWVNPHCSRAEIRSAARILAQFHRAIADLQPVGFRSEPRIRELLPAVSVTIEKALRQSKQTGFDRYLMENANLLHQEIEDTQSLLAKAATSTMPEIVIHCDFHPGNLKFANESVVGLLDFDWSKFDLRAFDFSLALWYFFTGWENKNDGKLNMVGVVEFLREYQEVLNETHELNPLAKSEIEFLPVLLKASNIYILNWALEDYYSKNVDPEEYLKYLKHNVCSAKWLKQADFAELEEELSIEER